MNCEINKEKFERFQESIERNNLLGDDSNLINEITDAVYFVKPFNENDNEDVFEFENKECFLLYIEKIYEGFDYDANVRSDFANQILYSLGKNDKEPFKVKVVPRKPFPEPRQKND